MEVQTKVKAALMDGGIPDRGNGDVGTQDAAAQLRLCPSRVVARLAGGW